MTRPSDAIPADLDVVLRVDVRRLRETLGEEAFEGLKSRTLGSAPSGDQEADRLVADALARADLAVIGLRPGRTPELSDSVLALSGDFRGLDPARYAAVPPFDVAGDLGAGVRVYERATARRSAPARVYTRAGEMLVFVSTAEVDSVERRLERGLVEAHLDAPARGVFSVAARLAPIADSMAERSPAAARLLRQGKELRGTVELKVTGLAAEVEIDFELEEQARRAADAAGLLHGAVAEQGGLAGELSRWVSVEAVASVLIVRLSLPAAVLGRLSACARGEGECS